MQQEACKTFSQLVQLITSVQSLVS